MEVFCFGPVVSLGRKRPPGLVLIDATLLKTDALGRKARVCRIRVLGDGNRLGDDDMGCANVAS